jgi:hypothetical protein
VQAIQDADLKAMSTAQIHALTATQVAAFTTGQILGLTTDQIPALTTDAIVAMTSSQFAAMANEDFARLTTGQVQVIEVADIPALTLSQLASITAAQHAALTAGQLAAMSTAQIAVIPYVTPLILDLNGDGVQTTSLAEGVSFDLRATGEALQTGWVAGGDGLLAIDRNGDGLINDGSELFGSAFRLADGTQAADGFAALASLDSNLDGVLSADDGDFGALLVWRDDNHDGITQSGELLGLSDLGIVSIGLDAERGTTIDEGNWLGLEGSYTTSDGQTHDIVDVWLRTGQSSLLEQHMGGLSTGSPDSLL